MADDAATRVAAVLGSGYIGQGPVCDELELALRKYVNNDRILLLNSGTSGLHLALHMLKLQHPRPWSQYRNEIITTPLTCTATNWPILASGLKIRWADVDPITGNIDPLDVARKIGPRTLAIMCVHWGGYPCDLDAIDAAARDAENRHGYRLHVIEDCAHALGARYDDELVGQRRHFAMFSFQAIKHLTMGDGGLLVCPDDMTYMRAKRLRWYGFDRDRSTDMRCTQNISEWGFKFNANDISAAIGLANLPHLPKIVRRHKENGQYYNEQLADIAGIQIPGADSKYEPAYWIYTLQAERRDTLKQKLNAAGIAASQVHTRNDTHDCVFDFRAALPQLEQIDKTMLCIPCGWWVTDEERAYIVDTIRSGW